jgi:hypothetical protein
VHARKAKLMMGQINKTDTLDARGLNTRQRNGTLVAPGSADPSCCCRVRSHVGTSFLRLREDRQASP